MGREGGVLVDLLRQDGDKRLAVKTDSPRALYELWLEREGLGVQQLQTIPQADLSTVIARLDGLILDPASIIDPDVWHRLEMNRWEAEVAEILVSRKRLLLDPSGERDVRVSLRDIQATIRTLRREADRVSLGNVINRLEAAIDEFERQRVDVEATQHSVAARKPGGNPTLKMDTLERRIELWRGFLTKESVATIVGAFLLVGLAIVIVVAMFVGTTMMDIITNSFLILLGYFFGQTMTTRGQSVRASRRSSDG